MRLVGRFVIGAVGAGLLRYSSLPELHWWADLGMFVLGLALIREWVIDGERQS